MTKVLATNRDVVEGSRIIQEYLGYVEDNIVKEISRRTANQRTKIPICQATETLGAWRIAMCRVNAVRGWPRPAHNCISDISDVHVRNENPIYNVDQLWNAFNRRAEGYRKVVSDVGDATISNFSRSSDIKSFLIYDEKQDVTCTMHIVVGYRLNLGDTFRLAFNMQNFPRGEFYPVGTRQSLIEYAAVENGKLGNNYRMRLPLVELKNGEREWRNDSTTLIRAVRFGPLRKAAFTSMSFPNNPSIMGALSKADLFLQQAANTLLPSSIAILFFPLGLNLVPLSLFSYVSTLQMLFYILMTDVLTVLPLAIKGVELINIHRTKYRAVVVRMTSDYDLNGRPPQVVGSESWATQCETKGNLGRVGIAFLTIALATLVVGVAVEYSAFSYVRAKRRKIEAISSDSGSRWSCSEDDDYDQRRSEGGTESKKTNITVV